MSIRDRYMIERSGLAEASGSEKPKRQGETVTRT